MTKFTSGPWAVDPDPRPGMEYNNHIVIADQPHLRICFMANGGESLADEFEANANLIAAAPDLYEACVALLRFNEELCADVGVSRHYPSAEKARRAVAKAEGQP